MPFRSVTPSDLFHCEKCGDCCQGYGGTYITPEDIKAISEYIRVDESKFVETFCKMSGDRPVLAQKEDGYCVFFDNVCTIHPVKPKMCRVWPFIKSILVDVKNWHIMAGFCPGMRTNFPDDVIQKVIQKVQEENKKES